MRSYLFLTICLLLTVHYSAQCGSEEPARISNLNNSVLADHGSVHIEYREKRKTGLRAEATLTLKQEGPLLFTLSSYGKGSYHPYENAHWEMTSRFKIDNKQFLGIDSKGIIYDNTTREVIAHSDKVFDYEKKKLIFTRHDKARTGESQKFFPLRYPTVDSAMLPFFLQKHVADGTIQKNVSFYVITEAMNMYHARARYVGQETIQTPTGQRNTHKIKIVADFGPLSWIGNFFAPPTYIWYDTETPHAWLKFEGLEVDLGSPHITGNTGLQTTPGKSSIK